MVVHPYACRLSYRLVHLLKIITNPMNKNYYVSLCTDGNILTQDWLLSILIHIVCGKADWLLSGDSLFTGAVNSL